MPDIALIGTGQGGVGGDAVVSMFFMVDFNAQNSAQAKSSSSLSMMRREGSGEVMFCNYPIVLIMDRLTDDRDDGQDNQSSTWAP